SYRLPYGVRGCRDRIDLAASQAHDVDGLPIRRDHHLHWHLAAKLDRLPYLVRDCRYRYDRVRLVTADVDGLAVRRDRHELPPAREQDLLTAQLRGVRDRVQVALATQHPRCRRARHPCRARRWVP